MLWWAVLGLVVVLLLAPLRRTIYGTRAWRFTVPLTITVFATILLLGAFGSFGLPCLAVLVLIILIALEMGFEGKRLLDENFGPPRDPRDKP
jgi:predicted RND superfamily exporter protein